MKGSSMKTQNRLFLWSLSEIRQGQLWPVSVALTLIIACVFALTALAERMEQVVVKQGKDALTADSVFVSANPLPQSLLTLTAGEGMLTSQMTRYGTMAFSDKGMQLVTVKAVESNYSLRGEMRLSDAKTDHHHVMPGELWMDERIFAQLGVTIGDSVTIGDADFTVTGKIIEEPGLNFNPFQQMPAVLIHQSDVARTGAIQQGSRVQFSLFINGSDAQLSAVKKTVKLTPSDRWRDKDSTSHTNEIFDKTQQYLSLAVAIVIIMAATTLVLTCQHYVATRKRTIAMLKSLGAGKAWLRRWLLTQVAMLLISAAVAGVLIGMGLEYLLRIPLVDLLPHPLPDYGWRPVSVSLLTSFLIAVPALGIPLSHLLNTSAVNVLQPVSDHRRFGLALLLVLVPLVPMLMVYWHNKLVWLVLAGILGLFIVLAVVSLVITRLLAKLPLATALKLALSRINRSSVATGIQFGALALSLMLLAIMWLIRTDLLSDWHRTLPANAANVFALNIAPYERDAYLSVLDDAGIDRSQAFPIIRGRLSQINGASAKSYPGVEEDTDALSRELNFTWGNRLPEYNQVLEGGWTKTGGVSVESEVARALALKLGDTLTFVINGQTVTAEVNSIRQVEWREMKPNFYFIFTPDVMKDIPATWLVSFRAEEKDNEILAQLSRSHPTVTVLDIRSMGAKIQALLTQIVWSVTLLAALGVIAGLLLIFTLLRLSLSQRQQEIQLYRTLGASRKRVSRTVWAEYGLMALVAGTIAGLSSDLVVALVMDLGFELSPQLHPLMWVALPLLTFITLAVVINSLIRRLLLPINKEFTA